MTFWIVQVGEPVPGIQADVRNLRYSLLAWHLNRLGHKVVRWCSSFNHIKREFSFPKATSVHLRENYIARFLHALPGYSRSTSIFRYIQQKRLARSFAAEAASWPRPDLIVAAIPTPELAAKAVSYGRRRSVPVVVDVEDQWPEIYLNALPRYLQPVGRLVIAYDYHQARQTFAGAECLTGVSETYLEWALRIAGRSRRNTDECYPLGYEEDVTDNEMLKLRMSEFRSKYGLDDNRVVFLFTGVFGDSYDLECAIRAARAIAAHSKASLRFVLAGDGHKGAAIRKLAKGLEQIIVTGWLGKEEVKIAQKVADVGLCLYAKKALQSLPYKPLEYMAASLPLISSLPGELRHLLDAHECGIYYEAGNAQSLVSAVEWMIEHPSERLEMGRKSRLLFERRFEAEKIYSLWAKRLVEIGVRYSGSPHRE